MTVLQSKIDKAINLYTLLYIQLGHIWSNIITSGAPKLLHITIYINLVIMSICVTFQYLILVLFCCAGVDVFVMSLSRYWCY